MPGEKPLDKIVLDEDCSCTYCGRPLYRGEKAYFDEILDSVYCCKTCRDYHLEFNPELNKLYEED
jgi:hypothetical protein